MSFRLEKDMLPVVSEWLKGRCDYVRTEVSYDCFRADLVGVIWNAQSVMMRDRKSPYSRPELKKKYHKLSFPDWFPVHQKIIAVEMKLTKMNEVVRQAIDKARYAEESWIAMPEDQAKKCKEKENNYYVAYFGIGVLAVTEFGCREIMQPKLKYDRSFNFLENAYLSERFWGYLKESEGK